MGLFAKLRGAPTAEENRLLDLARAWDALHAHVVASGSAATPEAEAGFLALKREIGQGLSALQGPFGSADLNREAGQAAARIRYFLSQVPTLKSLEAAREKDREGLEKAWHGVFLILAELSGAPAAATAAAAGAGDGPRIAPRARTGSPQAAPLGWPRPRKTRSSAPLRIATTAARWLVMIVLLGVILLLAYIIAEKLFELGLPKQYLSAIPGAETVVARAETLWRQGTAGLESLATRFAPGFYLPATAYIRTHPDNVEIGLFLFAAMLVGYLLFIRTR